MDWFLYALAALLIFGNVSRVAQIGKTPKPVEASTVALSVLFSIGIAYGLVLAAAN